MMKQPNWRWGRVQTAVGLLSMAALLLPRPGGSFAQQDLATSASAKSVSSASAGSPQIPPPVTVYMGREIAQTMHYTGAEWLIRDTREREERCSRMLANLGVEAGMTVCDMGCGNGFYSLQLARVVGPQGRILAVDVQPEMLNMLRARADQEGMDNITPILGSLHDPRLPEQTADLILLVDVYHEFSHPEQMLAAMRRALKPNGLLVLVEYRAEDPSVPIQPLHKMSHEQILRELQANGFRLAKQFEQLPWQHMLFFARNGS